MCLAVVCVEDGLSQIQSQIAKYALSYGDQAAIRIYNEEYGIKH